MNSRATRTFWSSAALALLAGLAPASAAVNVFTNATGNSLWFTGANWSQGHSPAAADDAYIPAGQAPQLLNFTADVGSLTVDGTLYMRGFLRVHNGFTLNGQMSIYDGTGGQSFLMFKGQGTINGTLSIFNGYLWDDTYRDNTAQLVINPTGTLAIYDAPEGVPNISVNTDNYGTINFYGRGLTFNGSVDVTRSIFNHGTFNNLGAGNITTDTPQYSYLYNLASWMFVQPGSPVISSGVTFVNDAYIQVDRANVTIANLFNVRAADSVLSAGSYDIRNGGQLHTAAGTSISQIGVGAQVFLTGAGSAFDALYACRILDGQLTLSSGANLSLYPPQLGTVVQHSGHVSVGPGSHLYIQGAYWQQGGTIDREFYDASDAGAGVFDVLLSSTFQGDLFSLFDNENAVNVGDEFTIVRMAPNACCGISGTFANVELNGAYNHNIALRYDTDRIYLAVLCSADFDQDGFITGLDFDSYVEAFEAGDARADFDRDGFITGVDYDLYVENFESGC